MRWPWRRGDDDEARQAGRVAADSLRAAEEVAPRIDRAERLARDLTRRANYYTREFRDTLDQQQQRHMRGSA